MGRIMAKPCGFGEQFFKNHLRHLHRGFSVIFSAKTQVTGVVLTTTWVPGKVTATAEAKELFFFFFILWRTIA